MKIPFLGLSFILVGLASLGLSILRSSFDDHHLWLFETKFDLNSRSQMEISNSEMILDMRKFAPESPVQSDVSAPTGATEEMVTEEFEKTVSRLRKENKKRAVFYYSGSVFLLTLGMTWTLFRFRELNPKCGKTQQVAAGNGR